MVSPRRVNLRYHRPVWYLGVFYCHHRNREWQRIHGGVEPIIVFSRGIRVLLFLLDTQRTDYWDVGVAIAIRNGRRVYTA